jgi:tripartite-type tricarboxylate transporter receptor subunit TctC
MRHIAKTTLAGMMKLHQPHQLRRLASAMPLFLVWSLALAQASSYPDHAITLIVPGMTGGAADSMARRLADELSRRLEQPIIVEDVGGASGALAARRVLHAPPDGYTLIFSTPSEMILAPLTNEHVKYRPHDFTPIGKIATTPMVIVARPELKIRDIEHLVRLAKARPGTLTIGITGANSAQALSVTALERAASIDLLKIPYVGGTAVLQDLLGGRIDLALITLAGALPYSTTGQISLLASLSTHRSNLVPTLPSVGESQLFKGVSMSTWAGLSGPASMPMSIVRRLSDALHEISEDEQFMAVCAARGDELSAYMTPSEFETFLTKEYDRYADLASNPKR